MDIKKNATIECADGNVEVLMRVMDNTPLLRITYSEKGRGTVMKRKEILTNNCHWELDEGGKEKGYEGAEVVG